MSYEQVDIFDLMYQDFKYDTSRPIRIIECFAGIGTQRMAFDRLGVDYEVIGISEVDKFAILSYASIHTEYLELRKSYFTDNEVDKDLMVKTLQDKNVGFNFMSGKHSIKYTTNIETVRDYYLADKLTNNFGDISRIKGSELPKVIDLLTYSFPCTDLSKAGTQKGLNNTRSGLVYEIFRIIEELREIDNQPTTLIMENVIDLIQVKFVKEFNEMQLDLEKLDYINYNFVMNAKDFGVAQNRERVFMVSLPRDTNYKEPIPFKLEKRLKDYLEDKVDDSYYLSDTFIRGMSTNSSDKYDRASRFESSVKSIDDWNYSTAITTREGNVATSTFLKIKEATKKGYDEAFEGDSVTLDQPNSKTRRGRVGNGIVNTLTTSCNQGVVLGQYDHSSSDNFMEGKSRFIEGDISRAIITKPNVGIAEELNKELRIRKLTPRECWRLMGIDDSYFNKANKIISDSQLYKQAGNAIVVDVFKKIIERMI